MFQARRTPGVVLAAVTVPFLLSVLLPGLAPGQEVVDLRFLDLPRWRLEEEFRLGSVHGEHDAFVRPWLKVDRQGRLYVADPGLPALLVFGPDGAYLRQMGRRGEGPGEYTVPVSFGFLGDTIWITDGVRRRVAFFAEDGRVLDDFALDPQNPGMEPPQPVDVLGPDDFLIVDPPGPNRFLRGYGVGPVSFQQSIVRRNRAGTRVDSLVSYMVESGLIVTKADADGFGVVPTRAIPQYPLVSYNPERDEITQIERAAATRANSGEFRVTVRRREGTVLADRRFRYLPLAMPDSVKDSIRDEVRSRFSERQQEHIRVALRHLELPDFLPPVSGGGALSEDGTRWIAREALPGVIPVRFLVTDAALNPLGTIELPPNALQLTGPKTRDHLWVVEVDEWNVRYLVRYRIHRD